MKRVSEIPTAYGVHCKGQDCNTPCNGGDIIYLTTDEYIRQMYRPDSFWQCPECGSDAWWDDDNFDRFVAHEEKPEMDSECTICGGSGYDKGTRCVCSD